MAFDTDGGVQQTTDLSGESPDSVEKESESISLDASTTSYTHSTSSTTYSEKEAETTPGVGVSDGDSSDEVDPRKLMSDPHINDLRWLYRTSFGKTLVDKPIDDSFKNGFEIKRDTPEETSSDGRDVIGTLDDVDFQPRYKLAQKKARRDGFSLLFMVLEDDSAGTHVDPLDDDVNVKGIKKLQPLTLDDLTKYPGKTSIPSGRLDESIPFDTDRYEIRETGIVTDMDPNSATYKEPLGYLVGQDKARAAKEVNFIHANRCFHYSWNPEVDSDLGSDTLGQWEGDSVLVTVYHILRGIKKGNWSIMQTLFRYAAKLYHVELPEDADDDDQQEANEQLQNLNAKGEIITPHGYEMEDFQTDGQLQPQEYFDVLFEQVCASMEMTKSVLFGTQAGVVSGSETDIKNYFNQVQRMRQSRIERDIREFVTRYYRMMDNRTDSESYEAEFDVEWGPLFKLSDLDQAETLTRTMQTLSLAIDNFIMTPQEARTILQEEWAEADIEWQDDFEEEEKEFLESINLHQQGAEPASEKTESAGSTQQQNGGGMEEGQTTSSESPTSASDAVSDDILDAVADRVVEKMEV